MDWLNELLFTDGIAHIILIYSFVIFTGLLLGKIKFFGVSLGATFVLFMGILVGHFGFSVNPETSDFIKDFGLILFIYSIGLQVGPGFFLFVQKRWNHLESTCSRHRPARRFSYYCILLHSWWKN